MTISAKTNESPNSDDGPKRTQPSEMLRKPAWLKSSIPSGERYFELRKTMRERRLATVCQEAKCPNIGKCWNEETATIMILGDTCTRACRFCHVKTGDPGGVTDPEEPGFVAQSCKETGLKYVVLTMVDRDDLPDGGASHVAQVVREIKKASPEMRVELLAGDFSGSREAIDQIVASGVDVYAHNLETVRRLSPRVRDARASYQQSLAVLHEAKNTAIEQGRKGFFTKTGLMLGLGEEDDEILESLKDMREHSVDFLTIGQYMRPTKRHLSVKRWVEPAIFARLESEAKDLGFRSVASGPLIRSSYKARHFFDMALAET